MHDIELISTDRGTPSPDTRTKKSPTCSLQRCCDCAPEIQRQTIQINLVVESRFILASPTHSA